jgi:hypothetical protein
MAVRQTLCGIRLACGHIEALSVNIELGSNKIKD